jgi:adenine C2-methylase RlmN of 23S rRNA A2503 and tRNA A37
MCGLGIVCTFCRSGPFEPFPDPLTPEEILEQAQGAAKEAHRELTTRKPKTDVRALFSLEERGEKMDWVKYF